MNVLQMSASASVMIVAVTLVRALGMDRLPKKTFLVLWGVALLRLLVPISLPSPISVYSLMNRGGGASLLIESPPVDARPAIYHGATVPSPALSTPAAASSLWLWIWGLGVVLLAGYFLLSYVKCRLEFMISQPVEYESAVQWLAEHRLKRPVQIRQSCRISAPLTYGILCPVILMPERIDWTDTQRLEYILTHEYVHIRRLDAVTKLLLTVALCIHWFNPFVWVMYILANRDLELSCDESVVRSFGGTKRSAYALALISMEEHKSGLTPFYNSFSKNVMEERVKAIMKYRKTTKLTALVAVALVICLTAGFATTAMASDAQWQFTQGKAGQQSKAVR